MQEIEIAISIMGVVLGITMIIQVCIVEYIIRKKHNKKLKGKKNENKTWSKD